MSARLRPPGWGGILGVDGKAIWVAGEQRCLLLAVNQTSQDIVHRLVLSAETAEGFWQLVHEAATIGGYPLAGLVIDGGPGWVEVWRDYSAEQAEHYGPWFEQARQLRDLLDQLERLSLRIYERNQSSP